MAVNGIPDEDDVKQYSELQVREMISAMHVPPLGRGGFGQVDMGRLPDRDGKIVAVKALHITSRQGHREFLTEVESLKKANHQHVVKLLGFGCEGEYRALIYEYAVEGSLHGHLYGKRDPLVWRQRLRIVVEAGRGVEYLQNGCSDRIFHRDIKSENILLGEDMSAKVGDFGIAKILDPSDRDATHVSTRVVGTFGYMDPGYVATGQLTEIADVNSFGVLLLEVIYGRRPLETVDGRTTPIVDWVKENPKAPPDGFFEGNYNPKAMERVIKIAKRCIQQVPIDRPGMKEVVRELEYAYGKETSEEKSFALLKLRSWRSTVKAWF